VSAQLDAKNSSWGGRSTALALLGALAFAFVAGACASPGEPHPSPPVVGERDPYVIGVTDRLLISVWKNPDLNADVVVRSDGKISAPLVDDVQAEGLTPEELKEVITQELSEYVTAPDVTVVVTEMNSNLVSVLGEVGRPGAIALRRDMTVLEAIAASGGFGPWSKKNRVRILRPTPDGIVEYRFDYDSYLNGDNPPESNLILKARDTVVVPD